jgi:hypothetical protein
MRDYDVGSFRLPKSLNWSLLQLLRLENLTLRLIDAPFGLSLVLSVRKPRELRLVQRARALTAVPVSALEHGKLGASAGATRA